MLRRVALGAVMVLCMGMGMGIGVANAVPVGPGSGCTQQPHASGQESDLDTLPPKQRWTETFTDNKCGWPVRAYVVCEYNVGFGHDSGNGRTIYSNGTSFVTCNALQHVSHGNGQWYNGSKWINLVH